MSRSLGTKNEKVRHFSGSRPLGRDPRAAFFSAAVLWCAVLYAGGKISACYLVNLVSSTTQCLFWLNLCQITVTHKAVVCFQHITVHCKAFSNFVYFCHISTAIRKGRRRWFGHLEKILVVSDVQ